jgi:hypothetical protein
MGLNVTYRLDEHSVEEMDRTIKDIVGNYSDASEAGFGMREQTWYFKDNPPSQKMIDSLNNIEGVFVTLIKEIKD